MRVTLNGGVHRIHHNDFKIVATCRNGTVNDTRAKCCSGHGTDGLGNQVISIFRYDGPWISRNASDGIILIPDEADGFFHISGNRRDLSQDVTGFCSGEREHIIHIFVEILLGGLATHIDNGVAKDEDNEKSQNTQHKREALAQAHIPLFLW